MHKALFILMVFSVSFLEGSKVAAQSSVYHHFPDSIASWKVSWSDEPCFTSGRPGSVYVYSIIGDTILGLHDYKKISRAIAFCSGFCCSPPFNPLNGYMGAFRDDTVLKKIYFIFTTDSVEKMIYDFGLNVGDTLVPGIGVFGPDAIITSIDSLLIGNSFRKRLNINGGMSYMVEGIGGSWGFIDPLFTFEAGSSLLCFSENHQALFPDTCADCSIITSVQSEVMTIEALHIYPNPFKQYTFLEFTNPEMKNLSLRIFDSYGRIMKSMSVVNMGRIRIERENLSGGIYFIQLYSDSEIFSTGKLIVE